MSNGERTSTVYAHNQNGANRQSSHATHRHLKRVPEGWQRMDATTHGEAVSPEIHLANGDAELPLHTLSQAWDAEGEV